jgi:hypothetical protein
LETGRFYFATRISATFADRMTRRVRRADPARLLPPVTDWRTTDAHEILKRQLRAREERPRIVNLAPVHPVFSDFQVHSSSGLDYRVEIRDVASRQVACTCTDFRINGLGTCKHVEAVFSSTLPAGTAASSTRPAAADPLRASTLCPTVPPAASASSAISTNSRPASAAASTPQAFNSLTSIQPIWPLN